MFGHLPDRVMNEEHILEDLNLGKCFGCSNALFNQDVFNYTLTCKHPSHYGTIIIRKKQYEISRIKALQYYRDMSFNNSNKVIFDNDVRTLDIISGIVIDYLELYKLETQKLREEVKVMGDNLQDMQKIIEEKDLKIKELQELIVAYRKVVGDLNK